MAELFFGWVAPERRLLLFQGTEKKTTKPMIMGELDTILFFPDATWEYHSLGHTIHGTGIFTYMNGWLLW